MEPEHLREDYTHKPDAPLEVLAAVSGNYRDDKNDVVVEVEIKNGRVTATVPGGGTFDFLPPDEDGIWAMRANPDLFQIRFNKDGRWENRVDDSNRKG